MKKYRLKYYCMKYMFYYIWTNKRTECLNKQIKYIKKKQDIQYNFYYAYNKHENTFYK